MIAAQRPKICPSPLTSDLLLAHDSGGALPRPPAMNRFLPHSLIFLAAHILFIGASIAVAAFN